MNILADCMLRETVGEIVNCTQNKFRYVTQMQQKYLEVHSIHIFLRKNPTRQNKCFELYTIERSIRVDEFEEKYRA